MENIEENSKTGALPNEAIEKKIFEGNCICVTNNGSVGFAYYQPYRFTCSHDVNPLYANGYSMNEYLAQFLIGAIEKQKVCFAYVRKWRPKRMVKSKILLPVNKQGDPDYEIYGTVHKKYNGKKIYRLYWVCEKIVSRNGSYFFILWRKNNHISFILQKGSMIYGMEIFSNKRVI